MNPIQRLWLFCKRRKAEFAFDFIVWTMTTITGAILIGLVKLFAKPDVSSWLVPTICILVMLAVVVFPIVRELTKPRTVVTIGSGASVGKIVYPVDPVKAAKGKYFEDVSLNVSSLVDSSGVIVGKTCKNCDIHGPAVLALDAKSRISGDFEHRKGTVHTVPVLDPTNPPAGIVGVADSVFDGCRFHNCGVVDHTIKIAVVAEESGD